MADLNAKLEDIVAGDNVEIVRGISEIAPGQAIIEAWMTFKEDHWDTAFVVQKHITTVDVPTEGVIYDTGDTDTVAHLRFNLQPSDTIEFSPFFEYVYDIQVLTDAGNYYTPETGTCIAVAGITLAD